MIEYYKELDNPCNYELKIYDIMFDPILNVIDCDDEKKEKIFKIIAKLEEFDPIYNKIFGKFESDEYIVSKEYDEIGWGEDPIQDLTFEFLSKIEELKYSITNYSYTKKRLFTNDEKFRRLYFLYSKFLEANPDYDYEQENCNLISGGEVRLYSYISSCVSLMTRIKEFDDLASIKKYIYDLITVLYDQNKIDKKEYDEIDEFLNSLITRVRIELSDHRRQIAFNEPDAWYITPYGYLYNTGGRGGHMGRSPYKSLWNEYATRIRNYVDSNRVLTEDEELEKAKKEIELPFGGMPKNYYFNPEDNMYDPYALEEYPEGLEVITYDDEDDPEKIEDMIYELHKNDEKREFFLYDENATRKLERKKSERNKDLNRLIANIYKKRFDDEEKHNLQYAERSLDNEELSGYRKAKDILEHGFVTSMQYKNYLNYISFYSVDYLGNKKNTSFLDKHCYDRNIVKLVAGAVSADEAAHYKFMRKLYAESNDLDRDLKTAFYDLSEDEFLVRCCGFHKILSHFAGKKERTIVTSDPNYEKNLALYIANGWQIDYVRPYIFIDGVLQESPDEHEKLLKFHKR